MYNWIVDLITVTTLTVSWLLAVHGCKIAYVNTQLPSVPPDAVLISVVAKEYRERRSKLLPWFIVIVFFAVIMTLQLAALVLMDTYYSEQIGLYIFTSMLLYVGAKYVMDEYELLLSELTTLKRMIELRE